MSAIEIPDGDPTEPTALEALHPLAVSRVDVTPSLHHRETYTTRGLHTALWHRGPDDVEPTGGALALCGGAMGGLL